MPAGALVWWNGQFHRVADPLRHVADGITSLSNPVGSLLDKANVGLFRLKTLFRSPQQLLAAPESTTLACLKVPSSAWDFPSRLEAKCTIKSFSNSK